MFCKVALGILILGFLVVCNLELREKVVLPKDLREQLDEVRGNVPASAFVRDLIMKAVNYGNG